MTINVNPERSTLTLPNGLGGIRAQGTLRAGPNGVDQSVRGQAAGPSITLSAGGSADTAALRAVTSGLDRASSVTDVALSAAEVIVELAGSLRDAAAGERDGEVRSLLQQIDDTARAASFDGINLLDGSTPGAIRLTANADGSGDIVVQGADLRPGGPLIARPAEADPKLTLAQAEVSLSNAEAARDGLREDSKRVEAHRAFVALLSDAVAATPESLDVEGARLAALSIKQTLSGTTLSLSNGAPTTVLSLFR